MRFTKQIPCFWYNTYCIHWIAPSTGKIIEKNILFFQIIIAKSITYSKTEQKNKSNGPFEFPAPPNSNAHASDNGGNHLERFFIIL